MLKIILSSYLFIFVAGASFVVERDQFEDFATNVKLNSMFSFEPACVKPTCNDGAFNLDWCNSFCTFNQENFTLAFDLVRQGLVKPFCDVSLTKVPGGSFIVPLVVPGFQGTCVLKGSNVALSYGDISNTVKKLLSTEDPVYNVRLTTQIQYTGELKVRCDGPGQQTSEINFCSADVVKDVIQKVDQNFGCQVAIDSFFCDYINVTQNMTEDTTVYFYNSGTKIDSTVFTGWVSSNSYDIALGKNIPTELSAIIKQSIANVLMDFSLVFNSQLAMFYRILTTFLYCYIEKCPTCTK